jgi:alkaline phosphatase
MQRSPRAIAKVLTKTAITPRKVSELLNTDVNEEELNLLINAKNDTEQAVDSYEKLPLETRNTRKKPNIERSLYVAINQLIDKRSNTGWTTGGHTGVDVTVHAFGKQSNQFNGMLDNTDIAKKLFKLLGKGQYSDVE